MVTHESRPVGPSGRSVATAFVHSAQPPCEQARGRTTDTEATLAKNRSPRHHTAVYAAGSPLSPFEGSAPVQVKHRGKAYGRAVLGAGAGPVLRQHSGGGPAPAVDTRGGAVANLDYKRNARHGQPSARPLSSHTQPPATSLELPGGLTHGTSSRRASEKKRPSSAVAGFKGHIMKGSMVRMESPSVQTTASAVFKKAGQVRELDDMAEGGRYWAANRRRSAISPSIGLNSRRSCHRSGHNSPVPQAELRVNREEAVGDSAQHEMGLTNGPPPSTSDTESPETTTCMVAANIDVHGRAAVTGMLDVVDPSSAGDGTSLQTPGVAPVQTANAPPLSAPAEPLIEHSSPSAGVKSTGESQPADGPDMAQNDIPGLHNAASRTLEDPSDTWKVGGEPESSLVGSAAYLPSEESSSKMLSKSLSFVHSDAEFPEGWMDGEEAAEAAHRSYATLSAPGRRRLQMKSATTASGERASSIQQWPGRAISAQPRTRSLFSSTLPCDGTRSQGVGKASSLVRSIPSTVTAHGFVVPRKPVLSREFPGGASDSGAPNAAMLPYRLSGNRLIPYRATTVLSKLPHAEETQLSVFRDGCMVKASQESQTARGSSRMAITGTKMLTQSWIYEETDSGPLAVPSAGRQRAGNVTKAVATRHARQERTAQSIRVVSVVTRGAAVVGGLNAEEGNVTPYHRQVPTVT